MFLFCVHDCCLYTMYVLFVDFIDLVMSCIVYIVFICFFFFKQKTAYEMRISDWSSDVCSSDLNFQSPIWTLGPMLNRIWVAAPLALAVCLPHKIGRASCRERVCQYV